MRHQRTIYLLFAFILGLSVSASCPSNISAQTPDDSAVLTSENIGQVHEVERLGHGTLTASASHPTENWVAIGSSSGWQIVTLPELTRISFSQGYAGQVNTLAWSPAGTYLLTGSDDGFLRLWSPEDGKLLNEVPGHDQAILTVDWSADGAWWATGSADNTIKIWSADTGEFRFRLQGHQNDVRTLAFSPDSTFLASGSGGDNETSDATIRLWEVTTGRYFTAMRGHQFAVNALLWAIDGQTLYSGGYEGTVRTWSVNNYVQVNQWEFLAVKNLVWSPDKSQIGIVTGRGVDVWDGSIILWNPTTAERTTFSYIEQNNVPLLAATWHDKYILAISEYYRQVMGVWDIDTQNLINEIVPVNYRAYSFDWSPDSQRIALATHEHGLRIWDVGMDTQVTRLLGHDFERYWGVSWSPSGQFIATTLDGVRVWSMPDGEIWQENKVHESDNFAYSPHWTEVSDVVIYHVPDRTAYGVALNSDSRASVSEDVPVPPANRDFSSDSLLVAIGQADGSIEIWTSDNTIQLTTLEGHHGAVERVRWSPDGRWLVSSGTDGSVRVWGLVNE